MPKFLTGKELEEAIYDIIYEAENMLLIVSPFIKLDNYFRKLFDKHISNSELRIIIVFGKNEKHVERSFNLDDFEYFKKFPNISIVYTQNLHAKYYADENRGIVTSVNLYDYSFKNNIEFGVFSEAILIVGREKHDRETREKCMEIIAESDVVYLRQPQYKKKFLGKDYVGSTTIYDSTKHLVEKGTVLKKSISEFSELEYVNAIVDSPRQTREEFEENENEVQPETELGICISCRRKIQDNPLVPYCKSCYTNRKAKNELGTKESYCHLCGKENSSTLKKPVCYNCFKSNKDKYEFAN